MGSPGAKGGGSDDPDRNTLPGEGGPPSSGGIASFAASMSRPRDSGPAGPATPSFGRTLGNRDFFVDIECDQDGIVVKHGNQKFSLEALGVSAKAGEHPLAQTIRLLIARRQATLRPGEPRYRPQVRFFVRPDGMRGYYLAYPLLSDLNVPMTRENLKGP
jgi:hypothetical protein